MDSTLENDTDPRVLTNGGQIAAILKRLVRERAPLTVRIPGERGDYRSALLKVDTRRGRLQLDELAPARGHERVTAGAELRVITRASGVETRFSTTVLSVDASDGIAYYLTGLPEELYYHQRRDHVRVPVPLMNQHDATFHGDGDRTVTLSLVDVSAQGLGAFVESGGDVARGDVLDCRIELRDEDAIACRVEVCYAQTDRVRRKQRVGVRFLDLDPAQRRRLERLLGRLQREQLRHT